MISGGRFKNIYELLNLRALKFHLWIKSTSFNVWVRYFVWNFKGNLWNSTQNIWPIHWKILFLYNIEILRALWFKSSYAFLTPPPPPPGATYLSCGFFWSNENTTFWNSGEALPDTRDPAISNVRYAKELTRALTKYLQFYTENFLLHSRVS